MALNWNWDSKIGEMIVQEAWTEEEPTREFTKTLYEGNAFLIMLSEWKEGDSNLYSLYSFFADETHAKNCLGLTKNHSNMFEEGITKIKKLRINKAKSRNWKKIIKFFTEAFDTIEIELYTEE